MDLRQIGEAAAETPNARAFGLKAEDAYAYVKRVVLSGERLDLVFAPPEHAANLSFFITGRLLLAFHLDGEMWWDYLTRIEEAWEVAQELDLDLVPPLMLRARRATAAAVKAKSQSEGTGAGSS